MSNTRIFILLSMLLVVLTACRAPAPTAATSELEARIAALEARVNGAEGIANAGDVAALTNRINVLEEAAEHGTDDHNTEALSVNPLFDVTLAMHIMDTAGFHGMDDSINGESTIDDTYFGTVNRVYRLMSVTPWPTELAEEATAFQATLAEFAETLSNDDIEAAKPLATRAHEEQHDFSHNIGAWINSQMGVEGEGHDH